ncbi:MAG: TIM44-related membrane protein TimA [Phenylobacterium sp.]|uniref:TIM44-related membrane protein TimA n=1 Tax=Phenylobacterium sp. TaxID=1871053 RepID=UPI0027235E6D|nr:TIM44-related membrane protein TimA [Phenylobacterium sp.]MDO8902639.1 TIM44-related membrane protein TimA [Phenylobacterium sp.]
MPLLELIIFAALAAIVLYQLYSVLGRRVGRQPEDKPAGEAQPSAPRAPERVLESIEEAEGVALTGLAAIRARDGAFDLSHFLHGSKAAYEMIVNAFAAGDRDTLRNLLSDEVYSAFESAITARETEGRTETVEFLHPPRSDMEKAEVVGDAARVTVRFLAEIRSRTKDARGEAVDDRRTAELWTFERNLKSRDPNWTLVHVDAAEA